MREPLQVAIGAAAAALAGVAAYTLGAYAATEGLGVGVIKRGPARPMVALTFDDGPDPEHTPRILDALGAAEVRATFFMVGRQVEAAGAVARAVAAAGHDVGNHTYGPRHLSTLSAAALAGWRWSGAGTGSAVADSGLRPAPRGQARGTGRSARGAPPSAPSWAEGTPGRAMNGARVRRVTHPCRNSVRRPLLRRRCP